MLTIDQIKRAKKLYPNAPVVLYVNTLASCKAECDVCCTSANAVEVIKSLDADTILFGPDKNLAEYVSEKTGKKLIPIPENGFCPTHLLFQPEDVKVLKMQHPDAIAITHPECSSEMRKVADFIGSTSKMCRYARIPCSRIHSRHRRRDPLPPAKRKPKEKLLSRLRRSYLPQHEVNNT
jgi:quinolinate synthase